MAGQTKYSKEITSRLKIEITLIIDLQQEIFHLPHFSYRLRVVGKVIILYSIDTIHF